MILISKLVAMADSHYGGRFPGGTAFAACFAMLSLGSEARAVPPRSYQLNDYILIQKNTPANAGMFQ